MQSPELHCCQKWVFPPYLQVVLVQGAGSTSSSREYQVVPAGAGSPTEASIGLCKPLIS